MAGQVINGKEIVASIREEIKAEVSELTAAGCQPGLVVVIVGDDPASHVYVNAKEKACEQVGVHSEVHRLPADTTQEELVQLIHSLNQDTRIHGILVQSPLPAHINEEEVVDRITPEKDVDCFHPVNVGNLMIGKKVGMKPCTPAGVIEVLKRIGTEISGKHAVVVGRSNIVGKPMAMLLLQENATVSIVHSRTPDMTAITRQADILVVAVGKANLIGSNHVKPGAIVVDVGMNRVDGKLCGDVDFEAVKEVSSAITPVPGCVGPMTITMLLQNTVNAARLKSKAH
ncbi:bifunctional methylenetetrahydrofolate dehydrogenase/methenyltetrahydrofolate cyclohydrolase FolD [Paenibacillus sp. N1-5-1-14]|uniref:bifunctional methylenetetrahydrofolate dehydrogenase/methenyltetrahydrofolate cyclohydrolase FolD n=1 Tax=Paenibacillus radicibacter TaxID=2972488 RepID=UPI002159A064|nr:bifunctional methylenetetrahydrofolate dehydrogenase/methenyltetrahydrofolate cyclohydrolase FolD [Paenibacillus radicibacter]MCR8642410.1 bifunctional methylenetetrahydrofolate dehydrogenase/methenyltetrahydrofolate cyclohydrolase FolD [Paenibacillus radicibacter]